MNVNGASVQPPIESPETDPTSGRNNDHQEEDEEEKKQQPFAMKKSAIQIASIEAYEAKDPSMRNNAFVSEQSIRDLTQYIVEEHWGGDNHLLFNYLNSIFRCQMLDHQVKKITYSNGDEIVVFHSGLQRRKDCEFLLVVLRQNEQGKKQKWRMAAGNINDSCLSEQEVMDRYLLSAKDVPRRCEFYKTSRVLVFDETYSVKVDKFPKIFAANKQKIYKALGIKSSDHDSVSINIFKAALNKSLRIIQVNPRLMVPSLFIDTEHKTTHIQLLLPLIIEYPQSSNKIFTLVLTMEKEQNGDKYYAATELLTHSMAYINSRLLGYVDSAWLNTKGL